MENIKSKIVETLKKILFVFSGDFAVPAGFSVLLFLLGSAGFICMDFNLDDAMEELAKLSASCFVGIIAATTAVYFTAKKSLKVRTIVSAVSGAAIFGIGRFLIYVSKFTYGTYLEFWGLFLVLAMIFMFVLYSGEKKDEALIFVFAKLVNAMIISHFIFVGFCLCEWILFHFIIGDEEHMDTVLMVSYVFSLSIIGLFYFLGNLRTNSAENPPLSKMEKGWYHFCLAPIFVVYIALLYVYFFKIIFTASLPDGLVNPFVSAATTAYLFMYFSQKQFDDKFTKIFYKAVNFAMVPLIVLQSLAVYQRISAYGLTGSRVCSIGYILIVLSFIALAIFKKDKYNRLVFVISAAVIFVLLIQPFNAQKMAVVQQRSHLEKLLVKNEIVNEERTEIKTGIDYKLISKEEMKSIAGIYDYLNEKDALPKYFEEKKFDDIFGISTWNARRIDEEKKDDTYYGWSRDSNNPIPIAGYKTLSRQSSYTNEESDKAEIEISVGGEKIKFDVSKLLVENKALEDSKKEHPNDLEDSDKKEIIDENLKSIDVDSRTRIVFTSMYFKYSEETKMFPYVNLSYYVLQK